ncbi:hypothetical protein CSAL01_09646 [Colletotrichum salicis]|uniref:Uncharacterized protein n=1 Tax=Colletotrichum salicis TaxID=1209931 RepID=A0A135UIF6_9PEZI|nr:hypothetical protein CSAL01_09646 [Colletotrichum salicis]
MRQRRKRGKGNGARGEGAGGGLFQRHAPKVLSLIREFNMSGMSLYSRPPFRQNASKLTSTVAPYSEASHPEDTVYGGKTLPPPRDDCFSPNVDFCDLCRYEETPPDCLVRMEKGGEVGYEAHSRLRSADIPCKIRLSPMAHYTPITYTVISAAVSYLITRWSDDETSKPTDTT